MFPKLFKPIFIEIEIYENWKFIDCVSIINIFKNTYFMS